MKKYWKIFIISFIIFGLILLGLYFYYKNYVNNRQEKQENKIELKKDSSQWTKEEKKEFLNSFNEKLTDERREEIRKNQLKILNSYKKKKEEQNNSGQDKLNALSKINKEKERAKKQQFLDSFKKD